MNTLSNYLKDDIYKNLYPQIVLRNSQNLGDGVIPGNYRLRLEPKNVFDEISRWTDYLSSSETENPESVNLYDNLHLRYTTYETDFLCTLIYLTARYKGIIEERHSLFFQIGLARVGNMDYPKDEYIANVEKILFAGVKPHTMQLEMNWREQLDRLGDVQAKKDFLNNYIINTKQALSHDLLEVMELELRRLEHVYSDEFEKTDTKTGTAENTEQSSNDDSDLESMLPEQLKTDEAIRFFGRAITAKLIEHEEGRLKWTKSNALLAFFCGILYCGDTRCQDPITKEFVIKRGSTFFPESALNALFRVKNLGQSRTQLEHLPKGYEEIDKLFKAV